MTNQNLETATFAGGPARYAVATLAGGCFWCTEAIFKRLKGVESVVSGYSGGNVENPSYEQVSSGTTGYAEVVQVNFDPKVILYEKLLEVFFKLHDPTQLNRQGNDVGTQYRSAIFYHDEDQRRLAEKKVATLNASKDHEGKIVTQIEPFKSFYQAEDYHVGYYDKNRSAGYCQIIVDPKITKLYKLFPNLTNK